MNLYTEAAAVLEKLEAKQGGVKSLVFASDYKNVRQLYALVCESLKYQPVLHDIFKKCPSLGMEAALADQPFLAIVLLYEHLIGKGLGRAGKIRSSIVRYKREIQEVCSKLLQEKRVTSLADLLSSQCQALNRLPIPRYVRVNLLKTTVDNAVAAFTSEGWIWQEALSCDDFQASVESLGEEGFGRDPLLPDLLVFPPGTDLHDHPLAASGKILLQDRASCFPAHVLSPPHGASLLDCCAAPGNKTSHAASLMSNTGKIWAVERDGKRMSLLRQQLQKAGVTNTKTLHHDFLSLDPHDQKFADVKYILVDPSCSGSGILSRMDNIHSDNSDNTTSAKRLLSLQRFQISILKHALHFPAARRVVYSTCSIHEEENEAVVSEVAEQVKDRFKVKAIFPEFTHRGKGGSEVAKACLRMSPKKDLTNGFFVACFERLDAGNQEEESREMVVGGEEVDGEEKGLVEEETYTKLSKGEFAGSSEDFRPKPKGRKKKKATEEDDIEAPEREVTESSEDFCDKIKGRKKKKTTEDDVEAPNRELTGSSEDLHHKTKGSKRKKASKEDDIEAPEREVTGSLENICPKTESRKRKKATEEDDIEAPDREVTGSSDDFFLKKKSKKRKLSGKKGLKCEVPDREVADTSEEVCPKKKKREKKRRKLSNEEQHSTSNKPFSAHSNGLGEELPKVPNIKSKTKKKKKLAEKDIEKGVGDIEFSSTSRTDLDPDQISKNQKVTETSDAKRSIKVKAKKKKKSKT